MGHAIVHSVHDIKESRGSITADRNEDAMYNGDYCSGLSSDIRFLDIVCQDYDLAVEAIESHDKGWYDQLAVKFFDYEKVEDTKKIINIRTRIDKEEDLLIKYKKDNSVSNRKSTYVGCTGCGSKINKEYVNKNAYYWNQCPLCEEDLSSKTVKDTVIKKEQKISDLRKEFQKELKINARKGKSSLKWLVKTEYHV